LGFFEGSGLRYDPQGRVIVSSNGFPSTDENHDFGSPERRYVMGLTNSFSYKDFTLGFTLDYRKGGMFFSGTADLTNFVGNGPVTLFNDRRTFIVPNSVLEVVDAAGNVTYQENTIPISETNYYDYWYHGRGRAVTNYGSMIDKTYFKVRDITLTYKLPKRMLAKWGIDNAFLTVYGRNLLTYLPSQNRFIDPEVSNFGNDLRSEYGEFRTGPSTRNFGAKLNLSF
jgi:hypothetical protein